MIFQNFCLFSSRNARENIAYPLEICGKKRAQVNERTQELLDLVGLSDRGSAPVSTLSGGQKQRVAIARALANNPLILFCDEATSALDPQTTHSILALIKQLQAKLKLTVVMITHQMEVVRDTCDNVAVLEDGHVAETGTVEEIFTRPRSEITREFLSHLTPQAAPEQVQGLVRWSQEGGKYLLRFVGEKSSRPMVSNLVRQFNVDVNIRAGGVQRVGTNDIGTLLVDITGPEAEAALHWLALQGIIVEETA
jgi:D-methionine transport system ATP-binding protein